MRMRVGLALSLLLPMIVAVLLLVFLQDKTVAVLQPAGIIAEKQRNLLIAATLLSLLVIVPVYILTIYIAWKYRAGNTGARYEPDWAHSRRLESIWWGIPCAIILVLSVIIWRSSHDLDPYRQISSGYRPVTVQVVALQWKWLFIYPEQGIATVNHLQIPTGAPVQFAITADAPMNSFWIPQLGGQVYAMSGMSTKLHLMADKPGIYQGSTANISGEGYAGMRFTVNATTQAAFFDWIQQAKASGQRLDKETYKQLARPGPAGDPMTYTISDPDMYTRIIDSYRLPKGTEQPAGHTTEKQHMGVGH